MTTRPSLERPLPHNLEAERSILGAVLLDNQYMKVAADALRSADFFLPQNRLIFERMICLGEKQQPIDTVTLVEDLSRRELLESAGGVAYVSQLMDGLPRVTNIEHYAAIVKEKAILRSLVHSAAAIQEQAMAAGDDANTIIDQADVTLRDIRQQATSHSWQKKFHTLDELPDGDICFLIDNILPEGVSFIGGSSGAGKTWVALSMVRALNTGRKFLGVWNVPEICNVVYLCPEMQARTFKKRCARFGIGGTNFRCQTIADGAPLDLDDPALAAAVRELCPIIFLDTAIRFSSSKDENAAAENQELARAIFSLIHLGAKAVVCLHHRSKEASKAEEMTLENTLRGTGDSGAISDSVYGVRYDQLSGGNAPYLKESRKLVRLQIRCVKARDFVPVDDFTVQLLPYIDDIGDFAVLTDAVEQESEVDRLCRAIAEKPHATKVELQSSTGIGRNRIDKLAAEQGWTYKKSTGWRKSE